MSVFVLVGNYSARLCLKLIDRNMSDFCENWPALIHDLVVIAQGNYFMVSERLEMKTGI